MTVKLWGVDRLHLRFDYLSDSNSYSFFSFLFKMLFISLSFIYETYRNKFHIQHIHIPTFKCLRKECMKLE